MSLAKRSSIWSPLFLDRWDPFDAFSFPSDTSAFDLARVDWKETPEAHVFRADLPGIKKEEVKVEVEEGNVLQIRGERLRETEEKTDTWHCAERSSGKFLRRFKLPENVNVDQIKAAMENGVLTVTVLKESVKKRDVRSIEINATTTSPRGGSGCLKLPKWVKSGKKAERRSDSHCAE